MKWCILVLIVAIIPVSGLIRSGSEFVSSSSAVIQYRIDAAQSKFIVHANRTGLAWFKGHSHRIAVKDFGGTAELDLSVVNPASMQMAVRAASLEETDPVFTAEQKKIIN